MRGCIVWCLLGLTCMAAESRKTLELLFVDTEGGQATLMVTPSGESLLIDAGWPGFNGRDAGRIAAAAKKLGVAKIDYLLVTHYHLDHVGGVAGLAAVIPVGTLVDHGPDTEKDKMAKELEASYQAVVAKGAKRLTVKPGDVLPLSDIRVEVVTAAGERIPKALPGGGQANPLCAQATKKAEDPTENARSVGVLVTFGKFRFVDLGDLTWNKELEVACPEHLIGPVDLYLTTHHGFDQSGPAAMVNGLHPLVAVMNNGARKGGSPSAWAIVAASPGLQDMWQLHYSIAGGTEKNVAAERIANPDEKCEGFAIEVSADKSGAFEVRNQRNDLKKTYKP